jgi:DNA-binding transcriptional LysR family regulator
MQIQQLRYFLAVIDHGGFTRAATHLGRTQQAISKSLRQLEGELGVQLLDRESSVPRPTAFGHELARFARQVISDETLLRQTLQSDAIQRSGRIRIGASPTAAASRVAAAVDTLERRHPGITVTIKGGLQTELLAALIENQIDVAVYIRTHPSADDTPGIIRETLGHESYRIIVGKKHPLSAATKETTLDDLSAHPWIRGSNSGDVEAAWREPFESAGLAPPHFSIETSSIEFCRTLLEHGRHLTILPTALVGPDLASGNLVALPSSQFEWQRPLVLAYRDGPPDVALLPLIKAFHDSAR